MVQNTKKTEITKSPAKSVKKRQLTRTKNHSTQLVVRVAVNQGQASPHVINLKNPSYQTVATVETQVKASPLLAPSNKVARSVPKTPAKTSVDFAAVQKSNSRLKFQLPNVRQLLTQLQRTVTPAPAIVPIVEEIEDVFAPDPDVKVGIFYIPKNWYRSLSAFILTAVVLAVPFQAFSYYQELQTTKGAVLALTNEAINQLKEGQGSALSFDLAAASDQFGQAKENFILARTQIAQINALTTELLQLLPAQGERVEAGLNLLEGGAQLAEVGQILTAAGDRFIKEHDLGYYENLVRLQAELRLGLETFSRGAALIEKVNPEALPEDQRATLTQVQATLPQLESGLKDLELLASTLLTALGDEQWQRYLIIFVNDNELRGSGGFMGSFALLDVDRGQIKNMEVPGGGTYDIQGQLVPRVLSPAPLHLINSRWEFHDANWWPDFPATARKIQWFHQSAGGPSTDGVIQITATLMERLLTVVGPIEMPEYGRTITSENFVLETQKIVQLEYDREENRPKQFIADLAPKLLAKLFTLEGEQFRQLLTTLNEGLNEKHLLLYFNDSTTQQLISTLGWDGRLRETQGDFLSVVHTNLAGGKTDGVIDEVINHQATVQADGSIINTVSLTRTHQGINGEDIFTGVQNNSYVRFYVPLGSTLLSASGFEKPAAQLFETPAKDLGPDLDLLSIETNRFLDNQSGTESYQEHGKTVFGNWLQLKPGETKTATISYRLPFTLAQTDQQTFFYSLLTQKQSGSTRSTIVSSFKLNDQLKVLTKYPLSLTEADKKITFSAPLTTDQFYGVTLAVDN